MKAILVIDVPDKYSDRDIYALHEIYTYEGNRYERIEEYKEGLHKLKPMPQRKIVGEIEKVSDFMKSDIQVINEKVSAEIMLDTELLLASGYNKCIDEILLGEEE